MSELIKRAYEVAGLGKVGSNSHPVHPATVHYPVALLSLANAINILYGIAMYLPFLSPINADEANTGSLAILGYYVNVIGVVSAVPSLLTGFAELYAMVRARGIYINDEKTGYKVMEPVVKEVLTHAALNEISVLGGVYNWLMERHRPHEDYRPYLHQIMLSASGLLMTLYAAYLGGDLVYAKGVGVQRQGAAAEEKKKKKDEVKK